MTGLFCMLTLFATFLTISSSNPVYAVLGLICLFTLTSSYLLLLGLGFIGICYLLIYVGAIAILFLFVVMMMNLKFLTYHLLPNFLPLATVITIFFFFSNFSFFFLFDSVNFFFFSPLNYPWSCLFNSSHHLTSLAYPLYSSFSLWLLFSSLLLLLAMIAPIILILPSSQHSLPPTRLPASITLRLTPNQTSVRCLTTSQDPIGSSNNKLQNKQSKITIYQRLFIGIKKGVLTPTLPEHLIKIQKNVFIRLFRIIGGISVLCLMTHRLDKLDNGILQILAIYICIILNIMFFIYVMYINYHRIKHIYKNIKSNELDIHNSPYDRFASYTARLLWCAKGFCEITAPLGITYGFMSGIDELRKIKGHEPIFLPYIANIFIPNTQLGKLTDERTKYFNQLIQYDKLTNSYSNDLLVIDKLLDIRIITKEEAKDLKDYINYNQFSLTNKISQVKTKIKHNLEFTNEIVKKK